ncbi:MAG: nucleoside hydrolase, partial [Actinomycetota bacterium]|nr:nucleoside hydrolase [Actinomycetota bacterium]
PPGHAVVLAARVAAAGCAPAALVFSSVGHAAHGEAAPAADSCVIVDTDFDIDDMMTIPTVIGSRRVAAIVTTEGYTRPELGASAVSRLIAEPGQRAIPVIVGAATGRAEPEVAATFGDYVLVYRALMNRLNNFLPAALPPAPTGADYVAQVSDAVADCAQVDILLLGAFSSFAHYSPAVGPKVGRVVITGRPLRGDPELEAGESFNCLYDRPACEKVFDQQLPAFDHAFVDVPRSDCDTTPNRPGCTGTVYGPTLAMARALGPAGLPNTLKQILLNDSATWAIDTWERSGYGGRSLFWDQSTALALLDPGLFRPVGAHLETVLSPQDFQDTWVEYTNRAVSYP